MRGVLATGATLVVILALILWLAGARGCWHLPMAVLDAGEVVTPEPERPTPALTRRHIEAATPDCRSHARKICDGGDTWWINGCGLNEERAEACDGLCLDGKCLPPPIGPRCPPSLWEGGKCEGDILRYCTEGVLMTVDCAQKNLRCAPDDTGEAACLDPRPCNAGEVTCASSTSLEICDHGQARTIPCARGARCFRSGSRGRCVREVSYGCGTTPEDDTDLELPVVAFIVADDAPAESEERIRASVEHAAASFSRSEHDTHVRIKLREIRIIVRPSWLSANATSLREMARDPEIAAATDNFFVPMIFTRELTMNEKKVAGIGTLPAGACGGLGMRASSTSVRGLVVMSRQRNATTLEHELGHYLGLCHTHQPDQPASEVVVDSDGNIVPAPPSCQACNRTGDGICDTPADPGLETCTLDVDRCSTTCTNPATPDPANLMSYYTACRRYFSNEQIGYLRQFLRTRRTAVEQRR